MTTPAPTGKLAWAQAQVYDAIDDRAVITALARGKVGLVRPPEVIAGTGLQMLIRGGWLGVASCGDRTSAVVGERADSVVQVNPGPGTGSREDVIWCDTYPDDGYWELTVITLPQAAGRPGLPIAGLIVPANANLASQMTIIPMDASLDRRLLSWSTGNVVITPGMGWNYGTWGQATPVNIASSECVMEPGQWYRVRFQAANADCIQGPSLIGRIGVGYRTAGQGVSTSILTRESTIGYAALSRPTWAEVEWVFRHAKTDAQVFRVFDGRMWHEGSGIYRYGSRQGGGNQPHLVLTVEDIGS
jgi:hypothetical protein